MLKTSVERLEGTTVKLTVTVPAADVDAAIAEAYKAVGKKMRIPGFRKGKAPRPVVDNYVGREHVLAEATEAVVNDCYPKAVDAEGLRPIESPETEELETVQQGEDFTFEADVVDAARARARERRRHHDRGPAARRSATPRSTRRSTSCASASRRSSRSRTAASATTTSRSSPSSATSTARPTRATRSTSTSTRWAAGSCPRSSTTACSALKPGDEARVEFVIPDTSSNAEFVGKTAQFDVAVHEIKAKKLPEVDDEFAVADGLRHGRRDARRPPSCVSTSRRRSPTIQAKEKARARSSPSARPATCPSR